MIKTFSQFQESDYTNLRYSKRRELEKEYERDKEIEQMRTGYKVNSKVPKALGIWFYNVPKNKESTAKAYGLKQTKTKKWGLTQSDLSGETFMRRKSLADSEFGEGHWFEFTQKQSNQYADEDAYIDKMSKNHDDTYERGW